MFWDRACRWAQKFWFLGWKWSCSRLQNGYRCKFFPSLYIPLFLLQWCSLFFYDLNLGYMTCFDPWENCNIIEIETWLIATCLSCFGEYYGHHDMNEPEQGWQNNRICGSCTSLLQLIARQSSHTRVKLKYQLTTDICRVVNSYWFAQKFSSLGAESSMSQESPQSQVN